MPPSAWRYALGAGLIVALVVSLAAVAMWQEKQRYRERASTATQNVARLLDQHLSDVLDKVDVVLRAGRLTYRDLSAAGAIDPIRLNRYLAQQEDLLPELDSLRIVDSQGIARHGRSVAPGDMVSLADRDYFVTARADRESGLIVHGPVVGRISRKWLMVFARRLEDAEGRFAGVIIATLATSQFDKAFASVSLGPHGAATIRTADLALVHRVPSVRNAVGSKDVSKQLRDIVQARPEGGEYIAATALDGIERSNAYRRLARYPFYVIVGVATDDHLGGWRQNVLVVSALGGLTIAIVCMAGIALYRAHRRLEDDIAERIRIGQALERAVAERTRLNDELNRRAQEAEAANRAKTTFLATMSHELRTPMNAIMGLTGIVRRSVSDAQQQAHLGAVLDASAQLLQIIDKVLDVSQLESGRLELQRRDFVLGEVVEQATRRGAAAAADRQLGLRIELPAELAALSLHGDAGRLAQVIDHLLGNAVKFTERGEVAISVSCGDPGADSPQLQFEVTDTGPGIAADDCRRLFRLFEQVDGSMSRRHGGVGLGLAICKRLVELMGGSIGVDSRPGAGSRFWFKLRLDRAARPATGC